MIINSLLDTDFYKLTQGQLALHQFPSTQVKYEFKCRNKANWTTEHVDKIKEEIDNFCSLRFTKDELDYLSGIRFFKQSYIDFLRLYQPNRDHCKVWLDNNKLRIIVEGSWYTTIYFEVPVLAIVNEVYFKDKCNDSMTHNEQQTFLDGGKDKLMVKIILAHMNEFPFADFGTRRRFSRGWQDEVVRILGANSKSFVGTSNVYLAKKYNVKPIGTMAHELMQIGQAIDVPLVNSQKKMLQAWAEEYRGDLGIALTDIINTDAFLRDFDLYFAKLYSGVRHDSGSPFDWADKVIAHYKKLGIDPKTKTLVFSDGLNFEKCAKIYEAYKNKINVSFGVGTNLTNNFDGVEPLQIVMKIVECNGKPVAKISDSPGKGMCNDLEYVSYLKKVFGVK